MNLASVSECMLSTNPNGTTTTINCNMIGNIGNSNGALNTLSPIVNPNQRMTRSHSKTQLMSSPTSYLTSSSSGIVNNSNGSPTSINTSVSANSNTNTSINDDTNININHSMNSNLNSNRVGTAVSLAITTGASIYSTCIQNDHKISYETSRSTLTVSPPNDNGNDIAPLLTISPVEGMSPKYLSSPLSSGEIDNHQPREKRQCIEQSEKIDNPIVIVIPTTATATVPGGTTFNTIEINNDIGNKYEEINSSNTINSSYLNTTTECLSDEKLTFQSKDLNGFPLYPQNQIHIIHPHNEHQHNENKNCRRKRRRKNGNDDDDDDYIIQVAIVDSSELRSLSPVNVPSL